MVRGRVYVEYEVIRRQRRIILNLFCKIWQNIVNIEFEVYMIRYIFQRYYFFGYVEERLQVGLESGQMGLEVGVQ